MQLKARFFIKETMAFISYLLVGMFSCLLAFFIVVQFLNPALSEDKKSPAKKTTDVINQGPNAQQKESPAEAAPIEVPPKGAAPAETAAPIEVPKGAPPTEALPTKATPAEIPPPTKAPPKEGIPPAEAAPPSEAAAPIVPPKDQAAQKVENNPDSSQEEKAPQDSSMLLDIETLMPEFLYDPEDRRDPFEDPTILQNAENIIFVPKTPPEEYDLNQLRLKGVIWDIEAPKALFQLPGQGGFYTLLRGDKVGKNGTIFEIREDEVVIVNAPLKTSTSETDTNIDIKIIKLDRLKL